MIDCGADWRGRLRESAPTAIVLTHAHSDHAGGLSDGAPCPVYATRETWALIGRFPISERRRLTVNRSTVIDRVRFEPVRVAHSIRAPTVGFRVSANGRTFFYVPDVAKVRNVARTLGGIDIYIGDAATMERSMAREKGNVPIGHASIVAQLGWCAKAGVPRAIFTHCGSGIVRAEPRQLNTKLRRLARAYGVDASIVCDGDRLVVPANPRHARLR